jgi:peptidoglycan hydrolase-like protein with peptidoglycan-binding domain
MTTTDVELLVQLLLTQDGGPYRWGGKPPYDLADPKAEGWAPDCSGFLAWGTGHLGHPVPGGSGEQLAYCRAAGLGCTVADAIATRGAGLWIPGDGAEHVAISLGNGFTIEAHDTADGIGSWPAAGRFYAGARFPGFTYGTVWSPPIPLEWSLSVTTIDLSDPTKTVTGPEIRALQMLLNLGIAIATPGAHGLVVDGQAGPATRSALGGFQVRHKLPVDYIAGGVVWEALCSQ